MSGFLATRGHLDQSAALHHTALAAARQAATGLARPTPCADLGGVQQLTGDYPAAAASLNQALALFRDLDDRPGQAHTSTS